METDDNPQSVPSRCADKGWEALTEDGDDGVEPLHLARICRTTEAEIPAQAGIAGTQRVVKHTACVPAAKQRPGVA